MGRLRSSGRAMACLSSVAVIDGEHYRVIVDLGDVIIEAARQTGRIRNRIAARREPF